MNIDPLYAHAREILKAQPEIGKARLAALLGVKTPTSRRLRERWWRETQGDSTHLDYVRVKQLKQEHPEWGALKIAVALGLTLDHAKVWLARWTGVQSRAGAKPSPVTSPLPTPDLPSNRDNELQDNVRDHDRDLYYRGTRITTLAGILEYAQVDMGIWEIERHTLNKYEQCSKTPEGMTTTMLFQIKVWLRRRVVEEKLQNLMQGILEQFRQAAPIRPAIVHPSSAKGLLEVSIMDHHLGKYCAKSETGGRDYDVDISERMFITALEDLISKSASLSVEKVMFVCGNDYFNTDNLGRTTTAGTCQDESCRYQESFLRGRQLLVRAIDRLRQIAPVEVVMVTGNHDTQRLYYLGDCISSWYRNTKDVTVDNTSRQRKYVQFHRNLIGFTHGNNEKHFDLPLLLATEQPAAWAASRHREFHLGHFHSRKHKMFVPSYDRSGVLVRILPSLCPPDAWHSSMGYNARLAAEALYFDPEEGCVANFTHSPN
jgi:hypothetical protein